MNWTKTPVVSGVYWYKDAHILDMEKPIISRVTIVDEYNIDDRNTIISINGDLHYLIDLRNDLPWFFGPLDFPLEGCPGNDGYYISSDEE